jgi:hypothetical protein
MLTAHYSLLCTPHHKISLCDTEQKPWAVTKVGPKIQGSLADSNVDVATAQKTYYLKISNKNIGIHLQKLHTLINLHEKKI